VCAHSLSLVLIALACSQMGEDRITTLETESNSVYFVSMAAFHRPCPVILNCFMRTRRLFKYYRAYTFFYRLLKNTLLPQFEGCF
jgi:hypothetical protein